MKINCEIIKDLLPLYCDDVCSQASKAIVEEHTSKCSECLDELKALKNESVSVVIESNEEIAKKDILKKVKRKILLKRIIAIVLAVTVTTGIALLITYKLGEHIPIKYYDGLVEVSDKNGYPEIYYTAENDSYETMRGQNINITVNGETKKIFVFYAIETLYTKYFENDEPHMAWDLRKTQVNSTDDYYAIYYYVFENANFYENPDFEKDLEQNGILLWQAE